MLRYILNRIIYLLPVLFIMSLVVFSFIHLIPGDPVDAILGLNASDEARAAVRKSLGLDRNIAVQYMSWIGGVVSGDFGESVTTGEPVLKLILEKLPATLLLAFSVTWPIFPSIGYVSPLEDPMAALRHLTLPALCMGTALAGAIARMTRSEMIEQLGKDYIITARAKGLSPREVTYRHALRNSLITVVTFTGLELGTLLGGAIIVETIFAWPGLGFTAIQAIFSRDYPMVQGIVLFLAFFFVFVNLLVDISYTFLNPQIRLDNGK